MARRKRVLKRPKIKADKQFASVLVTRLINRVMWDGKKSTATKIVTEALLKASEELQAEPSEVIDQALQNARPQIEVKSMRVGGANYQVPMEPYAARATRLGLTWIVSAARKQKGKPMADKLATVLIQSFNGEGAAVEKRNQVHQTAAGNKAFAHLAARLGSRR